MSKTAATVLAVGGVAIAGILVWRLTAPKPKVEEKSTLDKVLSGVGSLGGGFLEGYLSGDKTDAEGKTANTDGGGGLFSSLAQYV